MPVKHADDPSLNDLKKLLKRLEKIDPEARQAKPSDTIEPAAGNARRLQKAILDRAANDQVPTEALLQLKSRDGKPLSKSGSGASSELPVIVTKSLPASDEASRDAGAMRTVIIASVTAAVVSALATAGTVYMLNGGDGRSFFENPARFAEAAPSQSQTGTQSDPSVGKNEATEVLEKAESASVPAIVPGSIEAPIPAGGDADAELADGMPAAYSEPGPEDAHVKMHESAQAEAMAPSEASTPPETGLPTPQPARHASRDPADVVAESTGEVLALASSEVATAIGRVSEGTGDTAPGPVDEATLTGDDATETLEARLNTEAPTVAVREASEPSESAAPANAGQAVERSPTEAGQGILSLPDEVAISPDSSVGFPISIKQDKGALEGHYLIVSGLKRGARLSAGVELMFDTWRVGVADLEELQLTVPPGFARRLHVSVELRRPDGEVQEKTGLVFRMPGGASDLAPDSDEATGLSTSVLRNVDEGEVQVDNGNLLAARILFERAAAAGSARAAMLLAASYDPAHIAAFKTSTPPAPDILLARRWYERAGQLGAREAGIRLESLPSR
jgi:TPR repeat protein